MNQLISKDCSILSTEVAEMVEMTHRNLMRKLDGRNDREKPTKGYVQIIAEAQMEPSDFFIPSFYEDSSGKKNKCYIITGKGCEFLAHKFTGERGVKFTARYINRFHEMEESIKRQATELPSATRAPVRKAPRRSTWYTDNSAVINRICKKRHMQLRELYSEILTRLSKVYDIQACRVIYERENGYPPTYAIDIIPFFNELEEEVDKYLHDMDLRLSKDPLNGNPFK